MSRVLMMVVIAVVMSVLMAASTEPVPTSHMLSIDRSRPFDPEKFVGPGWSFWRGPANGDGKTGEIEQDKRSLALTKLDLAKVKMKSSLKKGERTISGEEFLKRLKESGEVRLDAGVFWAVLKGDRYFDQAWTKPSNKRPVSVWRTSIYFFGSPLRSPHGDRYVLYLFGMDGKPSCGWNRLEDDFEASDVAAMLE
ncbi:MAG: hypothetical protein V1821_04005 [bacterium]